MTTTHATRETILTYVRVDPAPFAFVAVARYMEAVHHVSRAATREQLRRLCAKGDVVKTARGFYADGRRDPVGQGQGA